MKVQVTFKTPDALQYAFPVVSEDDEAQAAKKAEAMSLIEQYVEWGEAVTIEFDTDADTATVMKV